MRYKNLRYIDRSLPLNVSI